mmetsp:Transcript_101323/g.272204  ORF Transcript_101323/g.272204 Transcript_101323/m.272204 type:complete len:208 (-) Transcript_101323:523-1146(-)
MASGKDEAIRSAAAHGAAVGVKAEVYECSSIGSNNPDGTAWRSSGSGGDGRNEKSELSGRLNCGPPQGCKAGCMMPTPKPRAPGKPLSILLAVASEALPCPMAASDSGRGGTLENEACATNWPALSSPMVASGSGGGDTLQGATGADTGPAVSCPMLASDSCNGGTLEDAAGAARGQRVGLCKASPLLSPMRRSECTSPLLGATSRR